MVKAYRILFILCLIVTSLGARAAGNCALELAGPRFLHKKYPAMHLSTAVMGVAKINAPPSTDPDQKIKAWLDRVDQLYRRYRDDSRAVASIKALFHRRFVTQAEDISESYFQLQIRIARELGHGTTELTPERRQQLAENAVRGQRESLDRWIEYFMDKNTDSTPTWFKYWALMSIGNLSKLDPETLTFQARSRGQALPFPELNRAALATVAYWLVQTVHQSGVGPQPADILEKLKDPNFAKLYARAWAMDMGEKRDLSQTRGRWVKFDRGSPAEPLVDSLQGMNTQWCTANIGTAQEQLRNGDFYVYYSEDSSGVARVPRLAIRMDGDDIAEVRGIGRSQEIDHAISATNILKAKLATFGDAGSIYRERSFNMKRLTQIEKRDLAGEALDASDLSFIYELNGPVIGFGYEADPRLKEIRERRDPRRDLVRATGLKASEISLTSDEARRPGIKLHYGDLELNETSSGHLILPEVVTGDLDLRFFKVAKGVALPLRVGGSLNLPSLESAEGLVLPRSVGQDLDLGALRALNSVMLPGSVGDSIYLSELRQLNDVVFPEHLDSLDLRHLIEAKNVVLPKHLDGVLSLSFLSSLGGLELPLTVGSLHLDSLTFAGGVRLPAVRNKLYLLSLESAEGVHFPETLGTLILPGLTSAKGLHLPKVVREALNLNGLTEIDGLVFPTALVGDLELVNLRSASNVTLPISVGGIVNFDNLVSTKNLKLPGSVGSIRLNRNLDLSTLQLPIQKGLKYDFW